MYIITFCIYLLLKAENNKSIFVVYEMLYEGFMTYTCSVNVHIIKLCMSCHWHEIWYMQSSCING